MKRFKRPFRQLQGKLTLSYTLTLVAIFLLVETIGVGIGVVYANVKASDIIVNGLKQEAPQAAPYFIHSPPDREALAAGLRLINVDLPNKEGPFNHDYPIFLTAVDTQGQTLTSIGTEPVPADTPIQAQLSAQNQANLRAVLSDAHATTSTVGPEVDGTLLAITPIVGQEGTIQGALVMKIVQPDKLGLLRDFLLLILVTGTIITAIAAVAGTISGYLTARGLTRRLQGLSAAANRWGSGDFSALTHDASEDELGQVARQFNNMAKQLQLLLQTRQKLATLEERNRLARDLHDSVKQQIFTAAMQIGATKILLKRDIAAAEARLNEVEKLVRQAQQELTSLIRELRPVALEGKGLVAALRELSTQWAGQTNIVANVRVGAWFTAPERTARIQTLPLNVEEALFRVAQEALANVSRHSQATLVQMLVTTTDDTITLFVIDNGQGFDTTRQERTGVGLLSMQERMQALGGDVQVESTPGKGTRIVAHCKM